MPRAKVPQCDHHHPISRARCELRAGHQPDHERQGESWPRATFTNSSAQGVLEGYRWDLERGHPWLPGAAFKANPTLGDYILKCLEHWVEQGDQ